MAELQILVNNESFIVNLQTLKYAISRNVTSLRPCIFYLLILSTVLHCKSPLFMVPILTLLFSCRGFRLSTITLWLSRWERPSVYLCYRRLFGEGNGTPLQYSCPENPMDRRAWWAAAHGVKKSRTWLSDFTFTFHFPALEKEMATHSSVLAWKIPGMVEPGGLLSVGSYRVGHDWSDLAAAANN